MFRLFSPVGFGPVGRRNTRGLGPIGRETSGTRDRAGAKPAGPGTGRAQSQRDPGPGGRKANGARFGTKGHGAKRIGPGSMGPDAAGAAR